jgi:hypothetical protein
MSNTLVFVSLAVLEIIKQKQENMWILLHAAYIS